MLVGCGWFVLFRFPRIFFGFGMFCGCSCLRHDGTESSQSVVLTMVLVALCVEFTQEKGKVPRMVVVRIRIIGYIGMTFLEGLVVQL